MSALDRIDPELVEIVARLRRDPSSFLHEGRAGGSVSRSLQAEVRPASRERANRAAERQLLARHRDELAVWLLRGASVALRQDPVFSKVYVVEDDSPHRRSWQPTEFRRGALIAMEDVARVPAHDLEREVGALRVLVGGSTELRGVLDACVLAERLRPFPSGAYLLGQAMLLGGQLVGAREVVAQAMRGPAKTDSDVRVAGLISLGTIALVEGNKVRAIEGYSAALDVRARSSTLASVLYAKAVAGAAIGARDWESLVAEQGSHGASDSIRRAWDCLDTLMTRAGVETEVQTFRTVLGQVAPRELQELIGGGGDEH